MRAAKNAALNATLARIGNVRSGLAGISGLPGRNFGKIRFGRVGLPGFSEPSDAAVAVLQRDDNRVLTPAVHRLFDINDRVYVSLI